MNPYIIADRLEPTADVTTSAQNWSEAVFEYAQALFAWLLITGVPATPLPVMAAPGAFAPAKAAFFTAMLPVLGTPGTPDVFCQKFEAAYNTFLLAGAPLAWPTFNTGFTPIPGAMSTRLQQAFAHNMTVLDTDVANLNIANAIHGYTKTIVWTPVPTGPGTTNSLVLAF